MRPRSLATALLIALAPMLAPPPALAQTVDDPVVKAARARFSEGVTFYDKGQYESARAAFMQAYALRKHPAVLINLAQSSLHSGHTLEAARYFQQYLHESASLTAAQRSGAEKGLAEARMKLGRLEVSAPDGTEIDVDGDHVGTAPLSDPVDVEPGSHTVKSSADSKSLTVAAGQVAPVRLSAAAAAVEAPTPAPPAPTPTPPPDEVATTRETPSAPPSAKVAPVAVADRTSPGFFSPPKSMAPFWIGLGVGVAGGAAAIVLAAFKEQALSNYQSVRSEIYTAAHSRGIQATCAPPPEVFAAACQTFQDDGSQINSDATGANIAIGIGIAGVVFSLGWYFFAAKQEASPASASGSETLVPYLGPHANGLGYSGSF